MALCMEAFTDTLPIVCNGFKGLEVAVAVRLGHIWKLAYTYNYCKCAHSLKGQYRHNQSRLSTGHGIGVIVYDEHSDWKLLARMQQQRK